MRRISGKIRGSCLKFRGTLKEIRRSLDKIRGTLEEIRRSSDKIRATLEEIRRSPQGRHGSFALPESELIMNRCVFAIHLFSYAKKP